jgi:5'(3')-deoxyribonucleotidase
LYKCMEIRVNVKRPVLLLDVDGVICDFIGAALLALRAESGVSIPRESITTWEIFDSIPEELQKYKTKTYGLLKARLGCVSMRPYDGSKPGVKRLQELAEVVIVTSPFPDSDTWMSERERWLGIHYGIKRTHIIHTCSKHHVKGDIFIDDKTSHVVTWADAHPQGHALLWNMKYNEQDELPDNVSRVVGWDQLHARVELWKHGHEAVSTDQVRAC